MSFIRKHKSKIIAILAFLLALLMILPTLASIVTASALTSDELAETRRAIGAHLDTIGEELEGLQGEAGDIQAQMDAITAQMEENAGQTRSVVDEKADMDQQMTLLQQQVDNTNAQIQEYNKLIAARQAELDYALGQEEEQNEKYKERIRSMEENGNITYLSILFNAGSFSDLLDNIDMIREIAESDQQVLKRMEEARLAVVDAQEALLLEKEALNTAKEQLAQQEAQLEEKRAEADQIILNLYAQADAYQDDYDEFDSERQALEDSILKVLEEYNEIQAQYDEALAAENSARAAEEAERRRIAEEEARRKAAEEAAKTQTTTSSQSESSSASPASVGGFACPLPYYVITDPFGPRVHPIKGTTSNHTGVDMAADSGTNIYASKSGTVVEVGYNSSYGNYVLISHSDCSTMYAHMSSYAVSSGDYVAQGQIIGYVGSTGLSTGPHLHFEIIINGERVNPMNYVS